MDEKNKYIEDYVLNIGRKLRVSGILVTDNQLNSIISKYSLIDDSSEDIVRQINELIDSFISSQSQKEYIRDLQDLPLQYTGITLNNQDIDLMLIAGSNNSWELQDALSKVTNINVSLNTMDLTEEQFLSVRQQVYDMYLDALTSRNDYIKNRDIELDRKIQYLKSSDKITDEDSAVLDNIISNSKGISEIIEKLNQNFSAEKVHMMYETIRDFSPIEKTGIKSSTLEASRNLLEQIKNNYNSITIDEEAKYGKIVLQDDTFEFKHLQKSLNFAQGLGKQVRLNTLLFYMDCPDELYNLEQTLENKVLVKQKLQSYVDATTRFVVDNGYSDTVRSVDVFNELLNRFAMSSENPYMYRGDIPQIPTTMQNGNLVVDDNIKSGWLKHLDIKDLCDVIAVARKNMPTTDFMYNDDHLTDSNKMPATIELVGKIQEYEKSHNVKLIDSIGTQMHVDNNLTKEEIRKMIIDLSQFELPIEITEFDLAMTHEVEGLNDEQIEKLRQQKINEIYECVDELKEQCNIRGFTIWSKTDKQNFRVFLENEERNARGLEPIETLHGGVFTENMDSKSKLLVKEKQFQNFNYHTHTNRCGHAGISGDSEYVKYARANGITILGFSEHVPVTELEYQDEEQRMHISDVAEYIDSIRRLQQENPDMKLLCGFEAEFDPMREQFLGELREKVDYMILGQHFVSNGIKRIPQKNNPNYPIEYANMVCRAMESGIFDIVAHPDIFMQFRDSMESDESKRLFEQNAMIASRKICQRAKEIGIPLEINFGGINRNKVMQDGKLSYPYCEFWKIAAETGVSVLYGVDAHTPEQFASVIQDKKRADNIIGTSNLNFVNSNYNPVEVRSNNQELNKLYTNGQSAALTYETHLISQITGEIMDKIPDESFNPNDFEFISGEVLSGFSEDCITKASNKVQQTISKMELISRNKVISTQEKSSQLNRAKSLIEHTNDTLGKQQAALKRAKESINTAIEIGCSSKSEISNAVTQLTEGKTTKNEEKKNVVTTNIQAIQLNNININKEQVNGPVLVKANNTKNGGSNGFISAISLVLIITFICIVVVIFAVYFIK